MNGRVQRVMVTGVLVIGMGATGVWAAEHGGQEHGGQEHGGQEHGGTTTSSAPAAPSAEQIRQAIRDYEAKIETEQGALHIKDEVTGQVRSLKLERVHERVGKTGDTYYSCADMRDAATNDLVDVDFDVAVTDGGVQVVDTRIHKVNGQARYTYDAQDNRIPL